MEESFVDGSHWIATDDIQGFRAETVFLGINHNIPEIEPPLWFETIVYRESADGTHGVMEGELKKAEELAQLAQKKTDLALSQGSALEAQLRKNQEERRN